MPWLKVYGLMERLCWVGRSINVRLASTDVCRLIGKGWFERSGVSCCGEKRNGKAGVFMLQRYDCDIVCVVVENP